MSPDDRHRPTPHGADKMKRTLVLAALVELGVAVVNAADWPQWQGPDRTRISKQTGLLKEWPVGGPRLVWTANGLGSGYGSMAVAVTAFCSWARVDRTASSSRSIEPMAKRYGPKALGPVESRMRTERGARPRGTPTVDGDRLYVRTEHGDLACLKTDGSIVWQLNRLKEFGGSQLQWLISESPLVDGSRCFASWNRRHSLTRRVARDSTCTPGTLRHCLRENRSTLSVS